MNMHMNKYIISGTFLVLFVLGVTAWSVADTETVPLEGKLRNTPVTVYKTPDCGCCDVYARYLERSGIDTNIKDVSQQELTDLKEDNGIPRNLSSCHTSFVSDYFVEGHIPIDAINSLLSDQPDVSGIALPGMPSGTPGMPGPKHEEWVIHSVGHDGAVAEFMRI